jgi:hypothetical protein
MPDMTPQEMAQAQQEWARWQAENRSNTPMRDGTPPVCCELCHWQGYNARCVHHDAELDDTLGTVCDEFYLLNGDDVFNTVAHIQEGSTEHSKLGQFLHGIVGCIERIQEQEQTIADLQTRLQALEQKKEE